MESADVISTNQPSTPISVPIPRTYRDLNEFLSKHVIQKGVQVPKIITNTRIGDKDSNIYGGSYHIPDADYPTFLKLYHRDIIAGGKKEYLTERQLDSGGPILIDIDIRHDYDVDERQYNIEHIEDGIHIYLEELKKMFQFDEEVKIPIYVLEKPTVNRVDSKKITKDGIHIIIGLQADHIVQRILRQKVIPQVAEAWADLPITNTWEEVFDEGISIGHTNWQLYGSRKPNHVSYKLTHIYEASVDPTDDQIMCAKIPLSSFDIVKNIEKLSVRYKDHASLLVKNAFVTEYDEYKRVNRIGGTAGVLPASASVARQLQLEMLTEDVASISRIRSQEELDLVLNHFLDNISMTDYHLKDSHDYVMILPPSYYDTGSYSKWIRVGWMLKNTSSKLLIVWLKFSSQATNFQYSTIPDLCEQWRKFDLRKGDGLTKLSLLHWARTDANEAYEQIRRNTIDYFVEQTINAPSSSKNDDRAGCEDFDLANVLYQIYKHEYVCVSVTSNIWYQYRNHRWIKIDAGTTLRKSISIQLRELYSRKSIGSLDNITTTGQNASRADLLQDTTTDQDETRKPRTQRILNIIQRLARTNDKKNIMTEAKELFFDRDFLSKLDTNPYLLCFRNGVFDFKEKIFRPGHPEDCISMSTQIDYITLNPFDHQPIMDEINQFINKIFPEEEVCNYAWDHLASTLIGTTPNQTFNMYVGGGSNGKSMLVKLMSMVLGDYHGDVLPTLITGKRKETGGLSPEVVQLKGKRYAVMPEPTKGEVIQDGPLKQYTSGKDPIVCRAPYMIESLTYYPQFKLAITCNNLPVVKTDDYGMWRRIRVIPFRSLFTDKPVLNDPEKPYQFLMDPTIEEKFEVWNEVFAAMLLKRACETNGEVKDCDIVTQTSKEYRKTQDRYSEFIQECIVRDNTGKCIKKTELNNEFALWHDSNYGGRGPSPKDLHECMNKEFGRQRNMVWVGVTMKRYKNGEDDDDGDEDVSNTIEMNEEDDGISLDEI